MRRRYTKAVLEPVVKSSHSYAEVLRKLGKPQGGGTQAHIKRVVSKLGLDTSHFTGQRWRKGNNRVGGRRKRTPDEILVLRDPQEHKEKTRLLRRAMMEAGVPYVCAVCGQKPEWNGEPLVLSIDHLDGRYWNNRKENLRFLCPNCHSQTPTFGSKNGGAYSNGQRDHAQTVGNASLNLAAPTKPA